MWLQNLDASYRSFGAYHSTKTWSAPPAKTYKFCSLYQATIANMSINTNLRTCYKVRCKSLPQGPNESMHPSVKLEGVVRSTANYVPLSPISFLERAAQVYTNRASIVYGHNIKYTWGETHQRCVKLAYALNHLGVSRGNIVATLAPNIPTMVKLH